jgi:uroporphyrinogen-III decarboxylase
MSRMDVLFCTAFGTIVGKMTKKENLVRTITRDKPSWIPFRYDGCLTILKPPIVVRPVDGGLDDWGAGWIATTGKEGSYPDGKAVLRLEEAGDLKPPATDFDMVTENLRERVARLAGTDTLVIAYNELTLFERAIALLGTDEFLMATLLDPDRAGRVLDIITDYQLQLTESLVRSGVSGVRFTDDWGMQSALFLAPEQWRLLVKPRLKRLFDVVKRSGGFVFQHSCGHIEEIVADLVEIGVDVLDPCQPRANDILRWKRDFGSRLSFMGGLDTQGYLSFGEPPEVERQVMAVVEIMGKGGGFIAAPSHTITIPEANTLAMLKALRQASP